MNKTLLLIIVDFLFLNLIALTRWEKAEPVQVQKPPVPAVAANAATPDQDLVAAMRQSLSDEQGARDELARRLSTADSTLASNEQSLAAAQAEKTRLASTLADTQGSADKLSRQLAAATQAAELTKDQLAQLQRQLDEKTAEADRQKKSLADLEVQQASARKQIEGLTVAVVVGESEKQQLKAQADELQTQVQAERADRIKVQESAATLAQGVGQLAQKSGELTKEIRDNRPISVNVLYSDFLANRVQVAFTATRKGVFGPATRSKESSTVFISDGRQVYALLQVEDTPFSLQEPAIDWENIGITLDRDHSHPTPARAMNFLAADPRVAVIPVDAAQVAALGARVYPLAADPFKFPDAVLISGSKGYGELGFKLDASQPGYVRVDNRFFKRLFGDFAPSRGDLVLSHTGELLGIMVSSDYCVLLKDFTPFRTIRAGESAATQHTAQVLQDLSARVQSLPLKLQ